MTETFQRHYLAAGYDNIAGLVNIETISVDGHYLAAVDDLGKWSDGSFVRTGDGNLQPQGYPTTAWVAGFATFEQWYYLYSNILLGNRTGAVTFQTRRHEPDFYVIANAILDIGDPPTLTHGVKAYFPFVYQFSRIEILEEEMIYGTIYLRDGSTQQADITTTPVKLTGWTANGLYSGTTPAYASSQITVSYAGTYYFWFAIQATKTASQTYFFNIRVNAVEGLYQCSFPSDADTSGSAAMSGPLLLAANDIVTIYCESNDATAGTHLTPVNMTLSLMRVALS